ncbi:hypothetical protein GB851_06340 [Kingella kingae]|nr:hypothetical protein GB851_06340 [Kingella kingae]
MPTPLCTRCTRRSLSPCPNLNLKHYIHHIVSSQTRYQYQSSLHITHTLFLKLNFLKSFCILFAEIIKIQIKIKMLSTNTNNSIYLIVNFFDILLQIM